MKLSTTAAVQGGRGGNGTLVSAGPGGISPETAGTGRGGTGSRSTAGKRAAWLLAAVVVLTAVCAASLAIGARGLPLDTVWEALTKFNSADGNHAVVIAGFPARCWACWPGGPHLVWAVQPCKVLPATHWPTPPASWAKRRCCPCSRRRDLRFRCRLAFRLHLVRFHRRRGGRRRGLRRCFPGPRRCHARQASPRWCGPERRPVLPDECHPGFEPGHVRRFRFWQVAASADVTGLSSFPRCRSSQPGR